MPVNDTHQQYAEYRELWQTTSDAASGFKIKRGLTKYLPDFIPSDEQQYQLYHKLAYFVNVTGRTLRGMVGAVFRKSPEIEVPSEIEYLIENFDGTGQSITQCAKARVGEVLTRGRAAMLCDYPSTDEGMTLADVRRLNLQASVKSYDAESVINWRTIVVGGVTKLSLVVLAENVEVDVDEFSTKTEQQYRALMLIDGVYVQRLYDNGGNLVSEFTPRKIDGSAFDYIPFTFVGADDNSPDCDVPPLYDLAVINIAQYRNIADRESALRTFSQMMLHVNIGDMSIEQWNELNPKGVMFGRSFGLQTINGSVDILQANPTSIGAESIKDKSDEMVSVGAKLISKNGINQTAEEARINASSENSVLDNVVGNVGEAFEFMLECACDFMGGDKEVVQFSLNRQYFDTKLTAQEIMVIMQAADRGDIAQSDVRDNLKRGGYLSETRTDEEIDAESEIQAPV